MLIVLAPILLLSGAFLITGGQPLWGVLACAGAVIVSLEALASRRSGG